MLVSSTLASFTLSLQGGMIQNASLWIRREKLNHTSQTIIMVNKMKFFLRTLCSLRLIDVSHFIPIKETLLTFTII